MGTLKVNSIIEILEISNGWGKINYNNRIGWVSLSYLEFISKTEKHWAQTYLDALISKNCITDKYQWNDFENSVSKGLTIALIDKISGGIWYSNRTNSNIHWAQPHVISLIGKKLITDENQWVTSLDMNISKALLLALMCNFTGGVSDLYKNRITDHWARNCLDTLCDRGIVNTPSNWTDFESQVNKGQAIALIYKTMYR